MKRDKDVNESAEKGSLASEQTLTREERSLDIGGSGQFAPGGYSNQQPVRQPKRRSSLEDEIVPPARC